MLVEADTTNLNLLTRARIGMGAFGSTAMSLYEPAPSNDYYNNTSAGVIRVCGTGLHDQSPWQYAFGFNAGRIMNSTPSFSQQIVTSTAARCTGLTEFNNPFVEATDVITASAVASNVLTVTAKNDDLTVGEQITIQGTGEPLLNGQVVTVASLIGAGPIFTGFTASFTTPDYVNAADTGTVSASDTITSTSVTTNLLTVTTNASDLQVGQQISLQGTAESFLNGQVVIVTGLIGTAPIYSGFMANLETADYTNNADTGAVTGGTDFFFFGLNQDCTAPGNGFTDGASSRAAATPQSPRRRSTAVQTESSSTITVLPRRLPVSISWRRGQTSRTNSRRTACNKAAGTRSDPRCGHGSVAGSSLASSFPTVLYPYLFSSLRLAVVPLLSIFVCN